MSDSKNVPKLPPPDDFSKTTPNIPVSRDDVPNDWEKTNYGKKFSPQPPADDWGKTAPNYKIPPQDELDFDKTYKSSAQNPKTPDWGITTGKHRASTTILKNSNRKISAGAKKLTARLRLIFACPMRNAPNIRICRRLRRRKPNRKRKKKKPEFRRGCGFPPEWRQCLFSLSSFCWRFIFSFSTRPDLT